MNLEKAIKIAVEAHTGQVDKGGNPYILHPLRVMLSLNSKEERIVGVLHDVVEDCEGWTWERLKDQGCSDEIIAALQSVSKTPEEEAEYRALPEDKKLDHYLEFIQRAKANKIGRNVKEADIRDNLDILRIGEITDRDVFRLNRYMNALKVLMPNMS
jgi:(p)ppGpp synthase/HD superfamily hydrolase